MVSLLEINKAIIDKLKQAIKDTEFAKVPFNAQEIKKTITRPSIKTVIDDSKAGKFNSACAERDSSVRIYFFAKDRDDYKIDNVQMQEIIECAFLDDLKVREGFFIPIESVESVVSDTVLICTVDLYMVELLPDVDADAEPMEELSYREVL